LTGRLLLTKSKVVVGTTQISAPNRLNLAQQRDAPNENADRHTHIYIYTNSQDQERKELQQ